MLILHLVVACLQLVVILDDLVNCLSLEFKEFVDKFIQFLFDEFLSFDDLAKNEND